MVERFEWRTSRDDSFRTLPFSCTYLIVFIMLLVSHLRSLDRFTLERTVEEHVEGWAWSYEGPYHEEHVPNLDNIYIWLSTSGMQFLFSYCNPEADKMVESHFCEIAPRAALVGDVLLWQERADGSERSEWILHTDVAQAYLDTHNTSLNRYHEAAMEEVHRLKDIHWLDKDTMTVELQFCTYSDLARMFTHNTVRMRIDRWGYPTHSQYTYAIPAEAYEHWALLALDAVFILVVLFPAVNELQEIVHGIRLQGCEGFKGYWGFWNVVDWTNILFGIALITIWSLLCFSINSDTLQGVLTPDFQLAPTVMNTTVADLESVMADLETTVQWFRYVHWFACLNTLGIMLKFFKAFQANARLQVATQTMLNAARDLSHFMIVFAAVFNAYVIVGHLLLCGDQIYFQTYSASFNTCFLALLGDFGWYTNFTEQIEPLASGIWWAIPAIWFWSFMVFAFLILLNMLLAIIISNYDQVMTEVTLMPDAPTLLQQTSRYMKRRRVAKQNGFKPIENFLAQLNDDDRPAHAQEFVTKESLRQLDGMSEKQAQFLMDWLQKDANAAAEKTDYDENFKLLQQVMAFNGTIASNVHAVSMSVQRCDRHLKRLEDRLNNGGVPVSGGGGGGKMQMAMAMPQDGSFQVLADAVVEQHKELQEQKAIMIGLARSVEDLTRIARRIDERDTEKEMAPPPAKVRPARAAPRQPYPPPAAVRSGKPMPAGCAAWSS
jgi:hypothetical protein